MPYSKLAIRSAFLTVFLDHIGVGMVMPMIGLHGRMHGAHGISLAFLGAAYAITQLFFAPVWGSISDQIGRKPIMMASLLGLAISNLLFAFAPSFPILLAARFFAGAFGVVIATGQAYVADFTSLSLRTAAMGSIGSGVSIGLTVGSFFGGILTNQFGIKAPGIFAASIGITNLIQVYLCWKGSPTDFYKTNFLRLVVESLSNIRKNLIASYQITKLREICLLYLISAMSLAFLSAVLAFAIQDTYQLNLSQTSYQISSIFLITGVWGFISQGLILKRLSQLFSENMLIMVGFFFEASSLLLFPLIHLPKHIFFIKMLIFICGHSLVNPCISSLSSKIGSELNAKGKCLSIQHTMGSIGRVIGPACGLSLYHLNKKAPFLIAGILCLLCMLFTLNRILRVKK